MIRSPNSVKIDLTALVYNLNQVKKLVSPQTRIMGIVKSDAYGHGLVRVAQVLEKNGVYSLGVALLWEALELRKNGIKLPIMVLCGIQTRKEAEEVVDKALTPVIYDMASAELLAQEGAAKGQRIHIQLKVDTGMGRLGVPHSDAGPFMTKIKGFHWLKLDGLTSHLSSADKPNSDFTKGQIKNFKKAVDTGRTMGLDLPLNNLANSAGIMAHRDSHFNMVRPGIMLYGGLPSPEFPFPLSLKPVMSLKGHIIQIRDLPDNTPVSYGQSYYTDGPRKVAVVSAGYGDGLPRSLSNRGKVLVGKKRVAIIGLVCMNMITCDVSGIKGIAPGDEVVLLGTQGKENITGDEMARWSNTISYEIFCSIGQRANKEYTK